MTSDAFPHLSKPVVWKGSTPHLINGIQKCCAFHGWDHIAGVVSCTNQYIIQKQQSICALSLSTSLICLYDLYSIPINMLVYFRHILACLHFNENVSRDTMTKKDGKKYMHVTYPKFKLGEEVVREVPVPPTYGKSV